MKEIANRVEKLAQLSSRDTDIEGLRILLGFTAVDTHSKTKLPCIILPAARDTRFYDRDSII
jgi:hypothetical protein